jgi:O-antigen ligase
MDRIVTLSIGRLARLRHKLVQQFTTQEWLIIAAAFSLFLSLYVAVPVMAALVYYLIRNNLLQDAFADLGAVRSMAAFVGLILLTAAMHNNGPGLLVGLGIGLAFVVLLKLRSIMRPELITAIVNACCAGSWIAAGAVLVQRLAWPAGQAGFRAQSTFMNANIYATAIEWVVLFCAYQLLRVEVGKRLFYEVTIALNLVGLYLCNSRTATVALGAGVLALMIWNKRWRALLKTLAVAAAFVAVVYALPGLSFRFGQVGNDLQLRLAIWHTALKGILANPLFGEGALTYLKIYGQYGGPAVIHAHNLLLEPLLSFGFVGTGLLVSSLLALFRGLRPRQRSTEDRQIFSLILSILLSVLVHGLADVTILNIQTGLLFLVALSFTGALRRKAASQSVRLQEKPRLAA